MASRKLYVGNISYQANSYELRCFLEKFGEIESCYIVRDQNKQSKGFGFVTFSDVESASYALNALKEDLIFKKRILKLNLPKQNNKKSSNERKKAITSKQDSKVKSSTVEDVVPHESSNMAAHHPCPELPDDVLLLIFEYLHLKDIIRIERVCRRWYGLCRAYWHCKKSLDFKDFFRNRNRRYRTETTLLQLLNKTNCHQLQCLTISASFESSKLQLSTQTFDLIGILCPNLHTLDLTNSRLDQVHVSTEFFPVKFYDLRHLTLANCNLTEEGLQCFLQICPDLEYLNIQGNERITGKCFSVSNRKLKTVLLNNCLRLTDKGIQLLAEYNKDIEVVKMMESGKVSPNTLTLLCRTCTKLKVLEITLGHFMDATRLELSMFQYLQNLERLILLVGKCVNNDMVLAIGRHCSKLRDLLLIGCDGITDEGLIHLCQCPSLSILNFSFCSQISDYGLCRLADRGSITTLGVSCCPNVTIDGIINVIKCSPKLIELDLSGCSKINYTLLEKFASLGISNERLRKFHLNVEDTDINADGVAKFCQLLPVPIGSISFRECSKDQGHPHPFGLINILHVSNDDEEW